MTEETRAERRMRIWNSMTPAQRDYDRFVGAIPPGASWACETQAGAEALEQRRQDRGRSVYEQGCSCHISPPCSYCTREADYDD